MTFILALIFLLPGIAVMGSAARIVVRYGIRDLRERYGCGPMHWFLVINEQRPVEGVGRVETKTYQSIVAAVRSLSTRLTTRQSLSFVWFKTPGSEMRQYVGVTARSQNDAMSVIRTMIGSLSARCESVEDPPPIPTESVAVAYRKDTSVRSCKAQVNEAGRVASEIAARLKDDEDVVGAIILTANNMKSHERSRLKAYCMATDVMQLGPGATFGGTVSNEADFMASTGARCSVAACTNADDDFTKGLLQSTLNSVETLGQTFRTECPWKGHSRRTGVAGAALGVVMILLAIIHVMWPISLISGILACSATALLFWKQDLLAKNWITSRIAKGEIVVPGEWWLNPRWSIQGVMRGDFRNSTPISGSEHRGARTAHPDPRQVIVFCRSSLAEFLSFPSYLVVGVAQEGVPMRGIPQSMVDAGLGGLLLGRSGDDQPVAYSLDDLTFSMYVAGSPGSGKTNFLLTLWLEMIRVCASQAGGWRVTPIWAEIKGDGAYRAWEVARYHPNSIFVDCHNPASTWRLAFEGRRLADGASVSEVVNSVTGLVDGLQFAWGDGIRANTREALDASMRIAMLMTPDEYRFLQLDSLIDIKRPNVMDAAFLVLGGDVQHNPSDRLLKLAAQLRADSSSDQRGIELANAIGVLSKYLDPKLRQRMGENLSSPLNKLSDLRKAGIVWDASDSRKDIHFRELVTRLAPVVLNLGPYISADGQSFTTTVTSGISRRIILITAYMIWSAIKANCAGWGDQRKLVAQIYDEVSNVAVDSESEDVTNVLAEAAAMGRSFGAPYFVGCQSPSQMPNQAIRNVLGFRTKFWFNMHDGDDLELAVRDLSSGDRDRLPYTALNIRQLPNGVGVGIMKRGNTITPPFTLQVPRFSREWYESRLLQES